MASTVEQPAPPPPDPDATVNIGATVADWLTADTLTAIGQDMAAAIDQHRQTTNQQPTWAQALAGVNPHLLSPLTTVPENWPKPAAVWRRLLLNRLMSRLKFAAWVTYTPVPRSLRVGARGRAWLTGQAAAG